jgi:urea transporter
LGDILTSRNIPALTLPFNLAATMVLMGGAHFARFSFSGIKGEFISVASSGNSTTAVPNVSDYDVYEVIVMGTLRGFGQVFLADDKYAGLLVMFGMFICSPIGWFSALIGSFIGTLTGMWVGAPPAVIQAGLWSYNSLLGAAAINGVFYTPSFRALFTCMLCGWGCALVGGALTVAFALTGLPTMT